MQKFLLTKGKWLFLNNLINIALTFHPAAVSLTSEVLDRAEANLHCSGSHFLNSQKCAIQITRQLLYVKPHVGPK